MGKTKSIILESGKQIRRAVYTVNELECMKYKSKFYIVELDHTRPFMTNSRVMVEIYKVVREAKIV